MNDKKDNKETSIDNAVEQWVALVLAHIEAKKQQKRNSASSKNNEHHQ